MKKTLLKSAIVALTAVGLSAGAANAASYAFSDKIDTWGGFDAVYIDQGDPLMYTHDLNQEVNFLDGHKVTDAWLELDFTNDQWVDGTDKYGSLCCIKWDYREFVTLAFDGNGWYDIGEVDNGQHHLQLQIDWLNDDGFLDVELAVYNPLGNADAWLDHSRVYGTAETPEPATMLLFGTGLAGLAGAARRRKK